MKGLAIRAFMGGVLLCLIASSGSAQVPPAGTTIVNQALADYTEGSELRRSRSNPVTNQVLPVYDIRLTPPGTVASPAWVLAGAAGDTLYCVFDLSNGGNAPDSGAVGFGVVPPSNTAIADVIFFADANGNGRYDPGEDDRTFLALAAGATTRLDAGVVLPAGASGGDAFVEVRAASANDTTGAVRTSVVQVTNTGPPQMTLHLGPSGNARAAPGGEGSGDDLTVGFTDYTSTSFTFHNDVLNDGTAVDVYELAWNDTLSPPPQITVTFADSTGQQLPQSPSGSDVYRLGAVAPGETRPIQVIVSSTSGPLASALDGPLSLRIRARSAADTLQENHTVDRLIPPQAVNPAATLAIDQAFRERLATTGDVVTLLVTARNITDSLTVDSVVVDEWAQPQLDFAGSSDFRLENGRMVWRVGSLAGGQSRTAVVKFVANTRVNNGTARAFGNVTGVAETGDAVRAGPASSTIRLENGPFVDEAVVLGEVYVDDNENRRRDAGEQGVAEVAIYLDSGEYAVTDSLGRFSLPRAFAGWRAIRMDEQTIPGDLEFFVPPGSRDQGRRENETFIHVLPGGNANVSFRLRRIPPPTGEVEHAVTYHEQVSVTRHARLYRAFSIPSSYFGLGKAMLGLDAAEQLRPVVEFLHQHPDWGVLMEGHTDSTPINTEEYPSNMELSVARAEAVGLYLESMSIARDRMVMVGYGDTRPLASNETVEGRRQNRRVEVSLIPPGVRLDDGDLRRISATVKDLSALPDTFDVAVRWEFQTTSERPSEARLRVELPYKFRSANVLVTMDGEKITPEHGVYPLSGFGRSRAARCEITLRAASGDTASVGDIEAVVEIVDPEAAEPPQVASDVLSAPVSSSAPLSRPRKQFRIRPFAGTAGSRPRTVELMSWTETVVLNPDTSRAGPEIPAVDAGEPPQSQAEPVGDVDPEAGGAVVVLEPREGELFSRTDQIKIRARVPLGARTEVFVGDEALEDGHIGQKAIHVNEGFEEITWFAVRISPGWNSVSVRSTAVDGTVHGDTLRVALADRPGMIEAQRKRLLIPADGKSSDAVRFEVRDVRGFPVADGFVATVVAGDSLVSNADARPDMRGLQVVSSRGHFELQVRPSGVTKRRTIELECNGMTDRCDVSYVSAARPAMAIGLIDLRIGKYQTGGDGSREGLDRVAGASEEGTVTDAEARVFLQSALPYGAALTARVDTEKRDDEPLLKQVNPEAQYPIYGDASEYRMAAPTQTGNYLSVDKGESFLRYGDFRTPFTGGRYLYFHQVATGVTGSLVGDDGAIHGFVTDTEFATYRDEFRADGTSGFFYLNHAPVAENSERLFLETRQRYQEEIIVELKPLVRNRDYRINPFDGSILFHEPVPFTDRYLNPNYIVAIYEARTVEKSNYLFGVRGDLVRDRRYNVGGTAISNSGDGAAYSLYGTDGRLDIGGVRIGGEFARSEDEVLGNGSAYVVEAGLNNRVTDTKIYYRRVDQAFHNPSFLAGAQEIGTRKAGLKSRLFLGGSGLSLLADGYLHKLSRTGEDYSSLLAGADFQHQMFQFFAGGRAAKDLTSDGELNSISSVVKLSTEAPGRVEFRGWWEYILGGEVTRDYPNRLATMMAIPFGQRLRVTATYEYLSADGRPGTNQFQAGLESRIAPLTTAYTRYAMNRTASGERMGALAGLRQSFRLRHNVSGTLAFEGYQSMADNAEDEYLAVKTGLATKRANKYALEGRYEYRWQQTRRKHLFQLVASTQLQSGFSLLLADALTYTPDLLAEDGLHYQGKLGLAYRPVGVPVQSLVALKNYYERFTPVDPEGISWRLVLSADFNVLPAVNHEVRFKYAYKRMEDYSYGLSIDSDADLVLGQYIYRFARCWDVDLWGRVLAQRHGTTESGAGVELGRLFFRSVRVAAGYSAGGFSDPDISGTDAWAQGFGVRIQLILSDWITSEFRGM